MGPLTVQTIKEYNRLVLYNLAHDEDTVPGEIRHHSVVVGRYRGAPASECEGLLQRMVEWLTSEAWPIDADSQIAFGIMKAVLAHLYLAWIHAFGDGNGRTARLLEVHLLLESRVPAAAAQLLSNHYNQTRAEYYRQLDVASRSGGDVIPFIRYALRGFVDQLREQIEFVKAQQVRVHWTDYIHDLFRGKERDSDLRRRLLILELSSTPEPVAIAEVRRKSGIIAEAYALLSDKTLQRDLHALEAMGVLVREGATVRPNIELMLARRSPVRGRATGTPGTLSVS